MISQRNVDSLCLQFEGGQELPAEKVEGMELYAIAEPETNHFAYITTSVITNPDHVFVLESFGIALKIGSTPIIAYYHFQPRLPEHK